MIRLLTLLFLFASVAVAQTAPVTAAFTYFGQSTFVMSTSSGLKVLMDPVNPAMVKNNPVDGIDVVTVSHEHGDHNYVELATGSPTILRGLAGGEIAKIDQTMKGVRIRTVGSYHDTQQGAQRGKNAIFIFEMPGIKIVHVGDLGLLLDAQQVAAIGPADVLLIPVSGGPTIDPKSAVAVADQLSAKVVVPMHFAMGAMAARAGSVNPGGKPGERAPAAPGRGFSLGSLDDFLKVLNPGTPVVQAGHTMTITAGKLPAVRTVMVMKTE
jgi:L-ascorbate metabolism protein UlaG (beta-lactamase superfamily)